MAVLETPFPAILSGSINAVVTDPADPGTPQTIIERDDAWHVIAIDCGVELFQYFYFVVHSFPSEAMQVARPNKSPTFLMVILR